MLKCVDEKLVWDSVWHGTLFIIILSVLTLQTTYICEIFKILKLRIFAHIFSVDFYIVPKAFETSVFLYLMAQSWISAHIVGNNLKYKYRNRPHMEKWCRYVLPIRGLTHTVCAQGVLVINHSSVVILEANLCLNDDRIHCFGLISYVNELLWRIELFSCTSEHTQMLQDWTNQSRRAFTHLTVHLNRAAAAQNNAYKNICLTYFTINKLKL